MRICVDNLILFLFFFRCKTTFIRCFKPNYVKVISADTICNLHIVSLVVNNYV